MFSSPRLRSLSKGGMDTIMLRRLAPPFSEKSQTEAFMFSSALEINHQLQDVHPSKNHWSIRYVLLRTCFSLPKSKSVCSMFSSALLFSSRSPTHPCLRAALEMASDATHVSAPRTNTFIKSLWARRLFSKTTINLAACICALGPF
jgi:hypothetical protein